MNRTIILLSIIVFWVVTPPVLMLMNVAGFNKVNTDALNDINADDFSLLNLGGVDTAVDYIFDLGKFTISNLGFIGQVFFGLLGLISIIIGVMILRGGGS